MSETGTVASTIPDFSDEWADELSNVSISLSGLASAIRIIVDVPSGRQANQAELDALAYLAVTLETETERLKSLVL